MNDSRAPTTSGWFRRHFNADYLVLYSGRTREQADREVEFVVRQLEIAPDETVLDLCCGFGRHLEAFRRRGIPAVGVDLSGPLLSMARQDLQFDVECDLVCADMRQLPFATGGGGTLGGFAVLVNFFTSFGYFESEEDNLGTAREMARVLRPGGRFSIDLMNRESAVASLVPRSERRDGPFEIHEERAYDGGRIEKKIRLKDTTTGEVREYFESVRVYREEEIRGLLDGVGLEVDHVFGDFGGAPRDVESPRMIVTGRRVAT